MGKKLGSTPITVGQSQPAQPKRAEHPPSAGAHQPDKVHVIPGGHGAGGKLPNFEPRKGGAKAGSAPKSRGR